MLKVKLLILALLLSALSQAQIFKPYSGNWEAKGFWKFLKSIKVEGKDITAQKVDKWDASAADLENSVDLENVFVKKNNYISENLISGLNEVGWGIKYLPFADFAIGSGNTLVDARQYLTAYRVTDTTLLTGVKFAVSGQGVYTGDAVNSMSLYKYNGTSWDKVAETTNDLNLWTPVSGTLTTKAFSATYVASPGWYYVAILYNNSAQTTAPILYAMELYATWFVDMGSIKLSGYIAAQASHATNITNAAITRNNIPFFIMLY